MSLAQLYDTLLANLSDEAPIKIEQGGVICDGVNAELDEWRLIAKGGQEWIAAYQQKLIEESGIATLRIKYNKVFGYFIEVSKAQAKSVPEYFIRKQTLTTGERFTTEELMKYQEKVLRAEEEIIRIEHRLFQELCQEVLKSARELQDTAEHIAETDVLSSFAELSVENQYTKPLLTEDNVIDIQDGRHPVVETLTAQFIPNNCFLDNNISFVLLSGPNMAGKSTYLRQNALIVYLTHIGCFVPASKAHIGLVDRIFTRVGAGDNLAAGESTFMMEMMEASTILHNATERSFIILDELGRGTSTFDGLSLAWAISEHIHDHIKAKCIFATHYHELIDAVKEMPHGKNFSVAVLENESQGVVFLHKIVEGGANQSYGIEVARLAGIPKNIINRAQFLLKSLEKKGSSKKKENMQMDLFSNTPQEIIREIPKNSEVEIRLKETDINTLTPLQALMFLEELKKMM